MGFQAESNLLSHTVEKGRQQQQTLTKTKFEEVSHFKLQTSL